MGDIKLTCLPYTYLLLFLISHFLSPISHLLSVPLVYTKRIPALAKKGILLDWEPECSFELVSIISSVRDYRICWLLNTQLHYQLEWKEEVPLLVAKGKQRALFNLFAYHDELNWLQFHFINNKYLGEHLVPELREVDHFLLIDGSYSIQEKAKAIDVLKASPLIQAVVEVDADSLRSKKNLIFE
ncbi:hypothetical protein BH09BAC1_BH09BAC1_25520 [soil metagenome]